MADPTRIRFISRRTVFKAAGAASAAAGLSWGWMRAAFGAPGGSQWVYVLDPNCSSAPETCSHGFTLGGPGCGGCYACIAHAANKRWATPSAVWRAHDCCRCTLTKTQVTKTDFERMFGKGRTRRVEFDLRRA